MQKRSKMREIRRGRAHGDKRVYAARDVDCEEDKEKKKSLKEARRGNLLYVTVVLSRRKRNS